MKSGKPRQAAAPAWVYAPPPARLHDALAIPIDIVRIGARLRLDAREQSATGAADVDFVHGLADGFPLFDLRQPITAAWLDESPLQPTEVVRAPVGRRSDEAMRMVTRRLQAGTRHRLRVHYGLGRPLVRSRAGTYRPGLQWSGGPSVRFNFGFTDLGGGRYLESWAPANLICDRFSLRLEVSVTGTTVAHTMVSNGAVRRTGRNRWVIRFPNTVTALSPMLELHPAHLLEAETTTVRMPESGRAVTVEAWKHTADPVSLHSQIDCISRWLRRNEAEIGPYPHGDRFTAFLHVGGMEYDGGCTSCADALEHEVFHSWWARGLKPASQNDGWIDEAWAVYHDEGGASEQAFDFEADPVVLCSANPWNRATPRAAYSDGYRFFQGLAAHFSAPVLRRIMSDYYRAHAPGLITTPQLEAHLRAHNCGDEALIGRAFRRFVYGRAR